jgi:hypothetical protein
MKRNPGKNVPTAATPRTIQVGFGSAGIWPFNLENFKDDDFLASSVL